jgi:hypothetical protein
MEIEYQGVSAFWALSALLIAYYLFSIISVRYTGFKAPLIGFKSIFEPPILARTRFFRDGDSLVKEGYAKVSSLEPHNS